MNDVPSTSPIIHSADAWLSALPETLVIHIELSSAWLVAVPLAVWIWSRHIRKLD
ncbi:MAG: hypothetical protein R3C97_00815 [Geminicoccaceae bacterium]